MKDCFWSLYNSVDDTRVDGLRTVQLRSLMRTIARGGIEEWLIWEEGTNDWKRASEVLHLFTNDDVLHEMPPIPPPVVPTSETAASAAAATTAAPVAPATPTIPSVAAPVPEDNRPKAMLFHETPDEGSAPKKKTGPVDERSSPRFLIMLKVFIQAEGRVITNTTVNVSVGGMKLQHPLPANLKGSFDVTLIKGQVQLVMRCRALKNDQETEVTRLLIEHCNRMDLLRTWLVRDQNEAIS